MTAEAIAATLQHDILSGTLSPGTELVQSELAARFQVSRIPIRDALMLLSVEGVVTVTPNRGARVIQLSPSEVQEIFDMRVLLECDCLRRAIPNMQQADFERIEHVLRRSNLEAHTEGWAEGDWNFHLALYSPSGRKHQIAMIEKLRRRCQLHIAAYRTLPEETLQWIRDHELIMKHCRNKETEAAVDALKRHLSEAGKTLVRAMPTS